jgi:predicted transcriptional regulator
MSTDDSADDDEGTDRSDLGELDEEFEDGEGGNVRERLEEGADKAVTGFDEGIVDLLSWVLETETRARIYVYLRQNPDNTSDEIAEGTGLYPSTVREALAELHEEGKVTRHKRESDGAGNNPYEYAAMAPSELVGNIVDDVQAELNTVFNLDDVLGDDEDGETAVDSEPVTITVADDDAEDETDDEVNVDAGETGGEDDADGGDAAEGGDEDDAGDADEN